MKRIISSLFAAVVLSAAGCHTCDICDDCCDGGGCGSSRGGHCCGSSPAPQYMTNGRVAPSQMPANMAQVPQGSMNR